MLGMFAFMTSCISGNYVSRPTGDAGITQAPLKLKLSRKARFTYYGYTNSAAFMYYENTKFKKKGDTIYMRPRRFYGDTTEVDKSFQPVYVINGDSLVSLKYEVAYIKKSKVD